ncbi:MAG TPA: glycosyl transferase family 2 [Succinivibrionaceae bacterium]|nr:glycosyl transferase family 2 [Succinivibrionaceae bacterium]
MMKISVIISTYNRPDALQLILQALNDQTDKNFEVIVGDDGSRSDTTLMIRNMQKICNYKIVHAFQEDQGFRLSRVRNLAASLSSGEYLIFLDGDCIPRTSFVKVHRMLAQKNCIVAGNRILLSESFTRQILLHGIKIWHYSVLDWVKAYLKHDIKRLHPFITFPYFHYLRLLHNSWKKVRGCNFALFKDDFFKVNGCDSGFEGWGYEDSDLAVRLIHAGIKVKSGRYATAVLHLWHKENDRTNQEHNLKKLQDRINSKIIKAADGIRELKNEN